MAQALDQVRTTFSRINLFCAMLAAALLFGIAGIVCFEVVGRALGAPSRLWVIEASEYALLFITFLGAPYLLEKNRHVILDLVLNKLRGGAAKLAHLFNASLGLAICVILTVVGIQVVADQFATGTREVTVMRPLSWWITAAMPVGTMLMAVQFFLALLSGPRREDE